MTGTRTPTVAPKAMTGNPAVGEAHLKNRYIPDADYLLRAKDRRQAQIKRFKARQKRQRRWVSLNAAIEWLAKFNEHGLRGTIPNKALALSYSVELRDALCDGMFSREIEGKPLPRVLMLSDDQRLKVRDTRVNIGDVETIRKKNDQREMQVVIERLWVPRDLLLNLFKEKRWPVAPWLEAPPAIEPLPDKKIVTGPTIIETYSSWIVENESRSTIPSRVDDLAYMRTRFPDIPEHGPEGTRQLREDHAPEHWKTPGRRKRSNESA